MRLRKNWFRTASRRTVRGCRRANPDNSSVALPPRLDAGQLIAWWRRLPSGGRFHLYLLACTGPHRDGPLPSTNVAAPGELGQRLRVKGGLTREARYVVAKYVPAKKPALTPMITESAFAKSSATCAARRRSLRTPALYRQLRGRGASRVSTKRSGASG